MAQWFGNLSLRVKLTLIMMAVSCATVIGASAAFLLIDTWTFYGNLAAQQQTLARVVAANSVTALLFEGLDSKTAKENLELLRAVAEVETAAIYNDQGIVVAEYHNDDNHTHAVPARPSAPGHRFQQGHLSLFVPIEFEGESIGSVYLLSNLHTLARRHHQYLGMAAVVMGLSLSLALALSARLQTFVSRPILNLAQTAQRASARLALRDDHGASQLDASGPLSCQRSGDDEVGRLVDSFNELLAQIEARDAVLRRHRESLEQAVAERTAELRRLNQELVLARDRAEQANRLKSEFLANTSHELRTPLNAIMGFLQLVLEGLANSPEEERAFLSNALDSSRHLLRLINDVLDIAKIEAGKLDMNLTRVSARCLLDEVYALSHVQARQKQLRLEMRLEDERLTLRADLARAKQALLNLVGNAIKFTAEGEVVVTARARPTLGVVEIEVRDTGIGVPRDKQHLLFEKFVQLDGSSTRDHGGTGLGLSITRSLVELMGGRVKLESPGEGQGTTVTLSLPLWTDAPPPAPAAEPSGNTVLVVDDDAAFRAYVTRLLQRQGCTVVAAETADEGLAMLRKHRPRLVTVDLALPARPDAALRDGWALVSELCQNQTYEDVSVLVISAYAEEIRPRLAVEAVPRLMGTLEKPVDPDRLIAALERALAPAGGTPRALLIDDDANERLFVRRLLESAGVQCEELDNGRAAAERLARDPLCADVVLLDLHMPELNGFQLLRLLKTRAGHAPPIIVLTNDPDSCSPEERQLLQEGTVFGVVRKSDARADAEALIRRVRALALGEERLLCPASLS